MDFYSIIATKDGFYDLVENQFAIDRTLRSQTLVKRYKSKSGAKKALERYEREKRWKDAEEYVANLDLSKFKLLPSVKPSLFHGHTVRKNVKDYIWSRKVRPVVLERGGKTCSVCGWIPKSEEEIRNLHLHEVEEYDFHNRVCHLKEIELICAKCHAFHHIARTRSYSTKEQWEDLLNHFIQVNGCDPKIADCWNEFLMSIRLHRLEDDKDRDYSKDSPSLQEQMKKMVRYTVSPHIPFANEMMDKLEKQGLLYYPECQ